MPFFVRGMLFLGVLALIVALVMVWRSEDPPDMARQPAAPISSGKPVGTSTLSHGGPASIADTNNSRDAASRQ